MSNSGASTGAMRKAIVIQVVASTTDSGGGRAVVWSTFKTVFAHVQQLSATNKYTQGVIDEKGAYAFTLRYTTGITSAHRISYDSKLFNITSIVNIDERRKYLIIKGMEGVAV